MGLLPGLGFSLWGVRWGGPQGAKRRSAGIEANRGRMPSEDDMRRVGDALGRPRHEQGLRS